MQTPEEFLESNGLVTRTLDRAALIGAFQREMDAGLAGQPSSLKMIPTFTGTTGETVEVNDDDVRIFLRDGAE